MEQELLLYLRFRDKGTKAQREVKELARGDA